MKTCLKRLWLWLKAPSSATKEQEEKEEQENEQEEQERLERERLEQRMGRKRGETDGYRVVR